MLKRNILGGLMYGWISYRFAVGGVDECAGCV